MSYIGLDVGTSGCKAAVVSERGEILNQASREYSFEFPARGRVELNPVTIWNSVREVLKEISPDAGNARALSVSSIGESIVPVDKKGKVLYNGIVYIDNRCSDVPARIGELIDPRKLYHITRVPLAEMFTLCRLMWMQENEPAVMDNADKVFMFGEYISYKLCGERAVDPSSASRTMMFDVNTNAWCKDLFDMCGVEMEKFSPITPHGTVMGEILPELAGELGLPATMKIVVGTHDQVAAMLGSEVVNPGELMLGEGSSESLNLVIDLNSMNEEGAYKRGMSVEPYVTEGRCMVCNGQQSHGTLIKWFVNAHASEYVGEGSKYAIADRMCADSSEGLICLPYLSRYSYMNPNSCVPASFVGISPSTTVHHMYRALLEGLSFETRNVIRGFTEAGISVNRVLANGGGSKSPMFMQMKADVLGLPVSVLKNLDSGVMGLAAFCAKALGDINNFDEAAEMFAGIKATYTPQRNYDEEYVEFMRINTALSTIFKM